jgi:hypothetical protein
MNNLIKVVEKFFFLILAIIIILAFIAVSVNAQTKNAEFNAFTINNGGDYTLVGNIKGMNKINAERGTNYANYWEMFEAYKKAQVIKTPLQQYMGIRKYDNQVKSIFDIPASRVNNVAKISFINTISFSLIIKPLTFKKKVITFGDTLILGKSKFAPNIVINKDILLSDEEVLSELKQGKWKRIKKYTYIRVMSKPDWSVNTESNHTPKRSQKERSIWEVCDRKKGDGLTFFGIVIVLLIYFGGKTKDKRLQLIEQENAEYEREVILAQIEEQKYQLSLYNNEIQEGQWYYESDDIKK